MTMTTIVTGQKVKSVLMDGVGVSKGGSDIRYTGGIRILQHQLSIDLSLANNKTNLSVCYPTKAPLLSQIFKDHKLFHVLKRENDMMSPEIPAVHSTLGSQVHHDTLFISLIAIITPVLSVKPMCNLLNVGYSALRE